MTTGLEATAGAPAAGGPDVAVPWRHRHLLDLDVLTWPEIERILVTADAMKEVMARPIAKVPALRGRNVTILFYEASTRTRQVPFV